MEIFKILKNTFFYRTAVDDCFCIYHIYLDISGYNCHIVSVIISKSFKEAKRRGRSKLLLPTHINYQSCTKEFYTVNHCTWLCTEYPYFHIIHSPKGSLRNDYSWILNKRGVLISARGWNIR